MTLAELLRGAGVEPDASAGDAEITRLTADSRQAGPGALFVCMPSLRVDAHAYLAAAKEAGAVAALMHTLPGHAEAVRLGLASALVANVGWRFQEAVAAVAAAFHGRPTASMNVVAITGTNGKTSTAWMLRDALEALGQPAAYLGTLGVRTADSVRDLPNTTPFAVDLFAELASLRDRGIRSLAIEVSSHALTERRADGLQPDVCVFTNLTQDHLDYHGNMAAYEAAKLRLFTELPLQSEKRAVAVLNADDPVGQRWEEAVDLPVVTFSRQRPKASVFVETPETEIGHTVLRVHHDGATETVRAGVGGDYNVSNLAAVIGALVARHVPFRDAVRSLEAVRPVPGRFEAVPNDKGIGVLVDYAHTPDAVEKLLDAVKPLARGRVITVFGCGGDRDRTKRPLMAAAASSRSDLTVVTSDNPRTEDPEAILRDVLAGILPRHAASAILDRREAIAFAIREAQPGDVVVIAGKGHENYQIIGREKQPMDDRETAREALGLL